MLVKTLKTKQLKLHMEEAELHFKLSTWMLSKDVALELNAQLLICKPKLELLLTAVLALVIMVPVCTQNA